MLESTVEDDVMVNEMTVCTFCLRGYVVRRGDCNKRAGGYKYSC